MIITLIITLALTLLGFLINLVMSAFPQSTSITSNLETILETIFTITTQANNCLHFLFGDSVYIIVTLAIALLTFKYVVYPIVSIFRMFFVKGSN